MQRAIEVRDLTKIDAQGEAAMRALNAVDLDAHRGELMRLMGPSGSGKTTLLSIMGAIQQATSGSGESTAVKSSGCRSRRCPRCACITSASFFKGSACFRR